MQIGTMDISASTLYMVILVVLGVLIAVFVFLNFCPSSGSVREKFTVDDENNDYNARLKVIDVFDSYLKRNPTPKEISKYSQSQNEQDIISAVMKDFPQAVKNNAKGDVVPKIEDRNKGEKKRRLKRAERIKMSEEERFDDLARKDEKKGRKEKMQEQDVEEEEEEEEEEDNEVQSENEDELSSDEDDAERDDAEDTSSPPKKKSSSSVELDHNEVRRVRTKIERIKTDVRDVELYLASIMPPNFKSK